MTNSPGTDPQSPSEIARDIVKDFRELRKEVQQLGGSNASIKFDSGGMPMVIAGAAAAISICCITSMILMMVWVHGEVSDLKNKDAVHDAYIQQHDTRINDLKRTLKP